MMRLFVATPARPLAGIVPPAQLAVGAFQAESAVQLRIHGIFRAALAALDVAPGAVKPLS